LTAVCQGYKNKYIDNFKGEIVLKIDRLISIIMVLLNNERVSAIKLANGIWR